jgi:hypothetical protein
VPPPPKEIEPTDGMQDQRRGEAGQFTGQGAPGLQKK